MNSACSYLLQQVRQHWRTTTSGFVTAVAGFITAYPDDFKTHPKLVHVSVFIMAGGLASMGLFSRDGQPPACPPKH